MLGWGGAQVTRLVYTNAGVVQRDAGAGGDGLAAGQATAEEKGGSGGERGGADGGGDDYGEQGNTRARLE